MAPTKEEPKRTLPPGHPQAGYTTPVHDATLGTGTLPDSEQDWYDERVQAAQDENDAIAEREDKIAKEEAKAAEATQEAPKAKTAPAKEAS